MKRLKKQRNENLKYFSQGTGILDHYIYIKILSLILNKFKNVSPNIITAISIIIGILGAIFISLHKFLLGLLFYLLFSWLDLLDWAIARKYKKFSKLWAFLDWLWDTIVEILILLSIGYYFGKLNYFVWLVAFIIFVHYFSIRIKWIYSVKERQLNMFDYIKSPLFLVVLFTRNDTRKVLLLIGFLLNSWEFIFYYFLILYIIALIGNFRFIFKGEKDE